MSELIRLSKRLAELVPCSRREAEIYIEGGWVSVDGVTVEEPHFKVATQTIELHPNADLKPLEPVTLLLHLPPDKQPDTDLLAMMTSETLLVNAYANIRFLKGHFARQTLAAPLQNNASGLVVFTQDWRVLRKLTEDAHKNEQEYIVEVRGTLTAEQLATMNQVITINGRSLPFAKVSWQNETRLRIALKNPQPDQIARLCNSVDLTILSMKRIRIGGVSMAKLPAGQWRYVLPNEKF
jgi:23S rRNA pseudouridine2604 synthase